MTDTQDVINLPTEQDSERWVSLWANSIKAPLVMAFNGEMGAGKTTIIRKMLRCLGIKSAIKSPTFSLVESYDVDNSENQLDVTYSVHHFDLYRIHDECELELIGFRDYFTADTVCCVEWLERAPTYLNLADLILHIKFKDLGREIHLVAKTEAGKRVLEKMHDAASCI